MDKRKAGVLLPVSALMSEYGIGDFGVNAKFFVDYIREIGFKVWQVLPITTIGAGNSPYSAVSAFAGNYMLIDVTALGDNLISQDELNQFKVISPYKVEYHFARVNKRKILEIAYSRIDEGYRNNVREFAEKEKSWLYDYAMYMAIRDTKLKSLNEGSSGIDAEWRSWEKPLRDRKKEALDKFFKENQQLVEYYYFEQYVFFKQWLALKAYANSQDVEIFGDMPIYVSLNSSDVWANKEIFMLDKEDNPTEVAGVPPDYFAKDGQLWGNPLYDYKKLKLRDYDWFIDRILHNFKLYDILRIDHFRGLCEYWAVPTTATTAKEGKWKEGPGMDLWKALEKKVKSPKIVAEDLGIIDEKVEKFLCDSGFPGMRVMQFGFDGSKTNPHLPYNYIKNTVAYTGTHDNDTTLGWLQKLDNFVRRNVLEYIDVDESDSWGAGGKYSKGVRAIARVLFASSANLVVMPVQDLSAYGSDTRINVPGVAEGNWEYRCTLSTLDDVDLDYYRFLIRTYGR
ncbi:MAG: 4-alpha-glucanotransferase [Christensenellales bacterium]|nr:4-alpha-glucanotransferase [Clostridiales bacterium]